MDSSQVLSISSLGEECEARADSTAHTPAGSAPTVHDHVCSACEAQQQRWCRTGSLKMDAPLCLLQYLTVIGFKHKSVRVQTDKCPRPDAELRAEEDLRLLEHSLGLDFSHLQLDIQSCRKSLCIYHKWKKKGLHNSCRAADMNYNGDGSGPAQQRNANTPHLSQRDVPATLQESLLLPEQNHQQRQQQVEKRLVMFERRFMVSRITGKQGHQFQWELVECVEGAAHLGQQVG